MLGFFGSVKSDNEKIKIYILRGFIGKVLKKFIIIFFNFNIFNIKQWFLKNNYKDFENELKVKGWEKKLWKDKKRFVKKWYTLFCAPYL